MAQLGGLDVDWAEFADKWRGGYGPSMNRVRKGELPWLNIDALHRMILDELLDEVKITGLSEAEKDHLNRVWHRLIPWPDAVSGLQRLRECYIVAPLSNGNIALLTNMAKHAGLPWDCILSSELAKHYKPDPAVYQTAADLLGLPPSQVMMVAAHPGDLLASAAVGFKTGFVPRPRRNTDRTATPICNTMSLSMWWRTTLMIWQASWEHRTKMFVGVDGCRAGWFAIGLEADDHWQVDIFPDVSSLWDHHRGGSLDTD